MKKILLIIITFFSFLIRVNAISIENSAKSAILIDQNTKKILYKMNENEKLPMASMTKIMSMLLIMEQIENGNLSYNDEVEITREAADMGGSQVFIKEGEKYKVSELLKSVAISSANDSITALAQKSYGSIEAFVNAMNKKAKKLNLKNTHFSNVHGLDEDNHYSSSYDMAIMASELLNYEDILKYTSVYEDYFTKNDGSSIWMVNTNKLVKFYDGIDGLKTGYTQNAGYCITATAKKGNLRLISVVMGEESIENRTQDTVKLLNYGFNTYKVNLIKSKKEILGKIKIEGGKSEEANLVLLNDLTELLNINEKKKDYIYDIEVNKVKAPVFKKDIVGYVVVKTKNNKIINKYPLTVDQNIKKARLWDLFVRNFSKIVS